MKPYVVSVDIELPRERVVALFDSVENLANWQPGFQGMEHLSGEPGEVGATARLTHVHGKNRIELVERITKKDLPAEFHGEYEWRGGRNTFENVFTELGPNRTRLESRCSYTMKTLPMKVMALLAPGMFRKQNQLWLEHFKAFCEAGADVRDGA